MQMIEMDKTVQTVVQTHRQADRGTEQDMDRQTASVFGT